MPQVSKRLRTSKELPFWKGWLTVSKLKLDGMAFAKPIIPLVCENRSRNMSRIRGKDTKPELQLRSLLHRQGFRFRLHSADLPGKPDIVFRRQRTAIFVHGCFWHQHRNCPKATIPMNNHDFWKAKLERNVVRDAENLKELQKQGWQVISVWECELKHQTEGIMTKIIRALRKTTH